MPNEGLDGIRSLARGGGAVERLSNGLSSLWSIDEGGKMNANPHAHPVRVEGHDTYWSIHYGDQHAVPDRPIRWPWDSSQAYNKRCVRRLKSHIAEIVRKHDRETQAEQFALITIPEFRPDAWGSEQL